MTAPITYGEYLGQFDVAREYSQIHEALHLFGHYLLPDAYPGEELDAGECQKDDCIVVGDVNEFIKTIWDAL